jgi:uncharacterized protein Usg
MQTKNKTFCQGQSILEFTFAMIAVALILMGMLQTFVWQSNDMARRRQVHEKVLKEWIGDRGAAGPLRQIRPTFYGVSDIEATVNSSVYNYIY